MKRHGYDLNEIFITGNADVVILTFLRAASDENFVKMTSWFPFPRWFFLSIPYRVTSRAREQSPICLDGTLMWRHNERDGVSNHRRLDCLFNRLFMRRSRKHQSSASLAFVGVTDHLTNSPHKGPVTREIFPLTSYFHDVINNKA